MSSTYCTRANIESEYGTANVADWADLNRDQNATTILARITEAIADAGDDIDSIIMTHYHVLPLINAAGETPSFVRRIAQVLAGVYLYESHGIEDTDKNGYPLHRLSARRDWAYGVLEQIRRGERKIPGAL